MRTPATAVLLALLCGAAAGQQTPATYKLLMPEAALPEQFSVPVFGQKTVYYDTGGETGKEAGELPVLVLVHGFGSQARFDWGHVLLPLSKHHRVIALDQIGFGGSAKPMVDYSVQTFVDFLGEFLRTLGITRFDLAGESLGGWIVADYTLQALAPANTGSYAVPVPRRLVLEDAAGLEPLHAVLNNIPVPGTLRDAAGVAAVFHNKALVTPEVVRENFAMKLKANDGFTERNFAANPATDKEVLTGRLGGITIPTLVVWGGDDQIVPLADGRTYAAQIPDARLVIVPECGHAPSLEKPVEFVTAVEGFLAK